MKKSTKEIAIISSKNVKAILRSPIALMQYLIYSGRKISFGTNSGCAWVECPCVKLHNMFVGANRKDADTAEIVTNRKTKEARIICQTCGGNWDVFSLFALDKGITRNEAVYAMVESFDFAIREILPFDVIYK